MEERGRLARVQRRCREFAATAAADLPLYRSIAAHLADDDEAASILLMAQPGQGRPVLLLAALHRLVLLEPDLRVAQWYPSVTRQPRRDEAWPVVRETLLARRDELESVVASRSVQTNEVNRAVLLAAALAVAAADVQGTVDLLELGSSAGLLLATDSYDVQLTGPGGFHLATPSPVRCRGENRGAGVPDTHPRIEGRLGLDLAPVDVRDAESRLWLQACTWPEVPGRLDRLRAALEAALADPPPVVQGDMTRDVAALVTSRLDSADHLVVWSSWALSYVARPERQLVVDQLAGIHRSTGRPVTYVSVEPPGTVPGVEAAAHDYSDLTALRWRDGALTAERLGTCHHHGLWLDLH